MVEVAVLYNGERGLKLHPLWTTSPKSCLHKTVEFALKMTPSLAGIQIDGWEALK